MLFRASGHEILDLRWLKHILGASGIAMGLGACGSSDGLPNVAVSISSDTTRAAVRDSISLTWSSTNATACSASGGWSGAKAASGTEEVVLDSEGDVSFAISCSGEGESNSASVVVEVLPSLEILSVGNINVVTNEDTELSVAIEEFSTNRDPLTELVYVVSEAPQLGTATLADSTLTYTPLADLSGDDQLIISASAEGLEAQLTVDIVIAAVDDPPVINLSSDGLALTDDMDLLFADAGFDVLIDVSDIDTNTETLTYTATINGAATAVRKAVSRLKVDLPVGYLAGKTSLEVTVSDGTSDVVSSLEFWGAEVLTQNPDRARVIQLFGDVRSTSRQIDHYVVLDNLTDQDIKTAVWEALTFFYDEFFVQGDERREALVDSLFNLLVVDFPEGLDDPFVVETGCNPSAPNAYCMSEIVPQALSFLDDLALYDDLTDVRVAADIFSLVTSVPGDGVAVGRYTAQSMTSAIDTEGQIGPNRLLWSLKHEMGHAFGWLGDHSTELFVATDASGEPLNDFSSQLPTVDFLYADITLSDSVSAVKWQHQYRDSNSIPGWNTVDDKTNEALGYWQGCYFNDAHCFRSSYNSVMNGEFTSDVESIAWLEDRYVSDAMNYDAVGNEAQFLRALQLQGSQDVQLYLPASNDDLLVIDHRVRLPTELFAIDWYVDGQLVTDFATRGIGYEPGGSTDSFVGRLTIPRKAPGSQTTIAYRIRELGGNPVITATDELDTFADVYLGRFSPEGGFYLCPESNTTWSGVAETYCHTTVEAFLSDGSLVSEVSSVETLLRDYGNVRYFIERSGLGVHVMIDWTYF